MKVLTSSHENAPSHFIFNIEHLDLALRGQRTNASPLRELVSLATQLEWIFSNVVVPDFKNQLAIYFDGGSGISCPAASYLLHIDLSIVIDNGCLLDACLAAALAALETSSWPRLVAMSLPFQAAGSTPHTLKVEFEEKTPSETVSSHSRRLFN